MIAAKSFLDYIGWKASKRSTFPLVWNEESEYYEFAIVAAKDEKRTLKTIDTEKKTAAKAS